MRISSCPARRVLSLGLGLILLGAGVAPAQQSKSSVAAKELADALDRQKLDSIAAPDPTDPSTFVAALYFPDAQLLVVSAKYSVPSLLLDKLAKKEFREVYIDLNAASEAGSKTFVMDSGADGLVARPADSQAPDTWEQGSQSVAFDGDWRRAKMSEDEYLKTFSKADERYARMLTVLAEQAKKGSS